mgnify:CR=1 FL=1
MPSSVTIRQARLVLPQRVVTGDILVEDGVITEISPRATRTVGEVIDGDGLVALPGLVDAHLRLDALESIDEAAPPMLAGGVTSFVGLRPASNAARLEAELRQLAERSPVHYGLYVALDDGPAAAIDARRARGIWVSPTALFRGDIDAVFSDAEGLVVVSNLDPHRVHDRWHLFDEPLDTADLARVHDVDTCVHGTRQALALAQRHGTRTHLLHVSTEEELQLWPLPERVTASVPPSHLFASDADVDRLGDLATCQPPLRASRHQRAAWEALRSGSVFSASAHWPARAGDKGGPLTARHPGWPTVEWWLPLFLDAVNDGRCSLRDVAHATSEGPAAALGLRRKGRLETGYDADIVLVDLDDMRTVGESAPVRSLAGWSPWQGNTLRGWPVRTLVAGTTAWHRGERFPTLGRELS